MEIYILIDNEPQGPYPQELVRIHLKSGQLKGTDLAAYAGSSDWRPLSVMVESWGDSSPTALTKRKPTGAILTVLVLLVVAAGTAFWMMRNRPVADAKNSSPKAETNTLVQLEDDGYPKTPEELDKWYVEPPEGQNAATYFLKGADAIQITNKDYASQSLPVFGQAPFPTNGFLPLNERKSITEFVQRSEPAWKLLQEGARFEHARYPIDFTKLKGGTVLWHLSKVRDAVGLLELRTVLSAANKQPKPAADAFLLSLSVAQSLKDEPLMASQAVRDASVRGPRKSLEFVFNTIAISPADLDRLAVKLATVEAEDSKGEPFVRAFVGARVLGPATFDLPPDKLKEEIQELQSAKLEGWTNVPPEQMITNLPAQRAFFVESYPPALAICKEPFPKRLKLVEYMDSRAEEAKNKQFYLAQAMLFWWKDFVHNEAAGLANVRIMQTAVALEQFRRANRKYPDALTELVPKFLPAAPADPFNGEPLFYMSASGYELHCSGATGSPIEFRVETPPKL